MNNAFTGQIPEVQQVKPSMFMKYLFSKNKLNASQSIYGFIGYMFFQNSKITITVQQVGQMITDFIKANDLPMPRQGWQDSLKFPEE